MFMIETILSILYYLVSLFYLTFGVLLLTYPQFVEHHVKPLFPVLASFKYQRIGNSINLILVGIILLLVGNLITEASIYGFFIAIILSGLEVYLGIVFYYFEERNITQSIIHFVLHIIFVLVIGGFMLSYFQEDIKEISENAASLFMTHSWNQ